MPVPAVVLSFCTMNTRSRAPAGFAQPLLIFTLPSFELCTRRAGAWVGLVKHLRKRWQADCRAPFVDMRQIFNFPRRPVALFIGHELSAVNLRFALIHADAVQQIGGVMRRNVTAPNSFLKQAQAEALEGRIADCMLGDSPRRKRASFARHRPARPAILRNDLLQARGIPFVDVFHARMIAVTKQARIQQFAADALVLGIHGQQFVTQLFIDAGRVVAHKPRSFFNSPWNHSASLFSRPLPAVTIPPLLRRNRRSYQTWSPCCMAG